jgi:hypothetical protein
MSRLSSSCGAGPNPFQDELGLQISFPNLSQKEKSFRRSVRKPL